MGQYIENLAAFTATARWDDVPPPVQAHAKLVLLDIIGVILAGSLRPEVSELRQRLIGGTGATLLAPGLPAADPRTAALLNAIAGRSIELCDGLRGVQPSVQIFPGLLAAGEQRRSSAQDILMALIMGYEVAGRLALGFTPRRLAHGNGQVALLAAVAAAARLRGFDALGISLAMRIATTMLLTPSYTSTAAGATTLNVAGGMSGFAAVLAPDLALAGYTARDDAIEEALGEMVGAGFDPARTTGDGSWQIAENYFRFYACCNPIHPALDCLKDVLGLLPAEPGAIDRIDASTHAFASVMRNQNPPNYFASKYSFPHAASVLAVRGGLGYADLDDTALTDPAIAALRARVFLTEDPAMSALAPGLRQARVTVTLKDGRQATAARDMSRRDQEHPDPAPDVHAKFRELAGTALTEAGVAAVEALVGQADGSHFTLTETLRRHLRSYT